MELLKKNILEAEAMLQKAEDAEGLNGVLRTTDILDAAGRSWGKVLCSTFGNSREPL
jgi:hypothetical protein